MSSKLVLLGWALTTADIVYHMPDHPHLLQQYIWQEYDRAPQFPKLHGYLDWWDKNLDGKLHSVRVAVHGIISPTDFKHFSEEFKLN